MAYIVMPYIVMALYSYGPNGYGMSHEYHRSAAVASAAAEAECAAGEAASDGKGSAESWSANARYAVATGATTMPSTCQQ